MMYDITFSATFSATAKSVPHNTSQRCWMTASGIRNMLSGFYIDCTNQYIGANNLNITHNHQS